RQRRLGKRGRMLARGGNQEGVDRMQEPLHGRLSGGLLDPAAGAHDAHSRTPCGECRDWRSASLYPENALACHPWFSRRLVLFYRAVPVRISAQVTRGPLVRLALVPTRRFHDPAGRIVLG